MQRRADSLRVTVSKAAVLSLAGALLFGCASALPGTYVYGTTFGREMLQLRSDGTFYYEAWSDDGGVFWRAEGTWNEGRNGDFVTVIARVLQGEMSSSQPLRESQRWSRVGHNSIIRKVHPLHRITKP